jgi:heme/copper-type cytochrome/quinol oxidase subunit 2
MENLNDMVNALGGWVNTILFFAAGIVIYFLVKFIWNKTRPQVKELTPLDDTLTRENAATIVFRNFYKIKKIDAIEKRWSVKMAKAASVLIPPGTHTLTFDYDEENVASGSGLTAHGVVEAGKMYLLRSKITKSEFMRKEMMSLLVECKGDDLKNYLKKPSNEFL